jgi:crossover junction endodeoxyribonuclease RuvC
VQIVLGIDPGLAATGYGVVQAVGNRVAHLAHGVIRTAASEDYGARLVAIRDRLLAVVLEHKPDAAAIELLYFSRNVKSAIPVAQARGVIILVLAELGIPFAEYQPGSIKQAVAGQQRAEKSQVIGSVRLVLGLDEAPSSSHGADALAVALCHCQHAGMRAAIERAQAGAGTGAPS